MDTSLAESHKWEDMLRSIEKAIEFDYLTGRLKDCNLLMLEGGKVPSHLIAALRRLIEQGMDEYQVVLAWLLVIGQKPDGPQFSRDAMRGIRKAATGANIHRRTLEQVEKVAAGATASAAR